MKKSLSIVTHYKSETIQVWMDGLTRHNGYYPDTVVAEHNKQD